MMNSTARANLVQLDAQVGQHLGRDAFALAHQAEQEMLGPDVVMVEALRFFLRECQDFARSFGEFVEIACHSRLP